MKGCWNLLNTHTRDEERYIDLQSYFRLKKRRGVVLPLEFETTHFVCNPLMKRIMSCLTLTLVRHQ